MKDLQLRVQSPPFVRASHSTQKLMGWVLIALLPAVVAAYYFFGQPALIHIALTVLAALISEIVVQFAFHRPFTILDGSAAITGLLLALNLPPDAPYWIGPVGAVLAIVIVKQLFGGLGHNFVNPALAARALLLASWPTHMVAFVPPFSSGASLGAAASATSLDAAAYATPLIVMKAGEAAGTWPSMMQMFLGEIGGCIGETSTLALMLGGILLVFLGVIDFRIPTGIIATVFVMGTFFGSDSFSLEFGLRHIMAGGTMLGAIFMATDYVTSPVTKRGRWIYGILIGFIAMLIRLWGSYPDGVSFAILLMNIATPLIERFTIPRKFGEVGKHAG